MNILFLTNLYPPYDLGGYELECEEIALKLADRKHNVSVLTSRFGGGRLHEPERQVTRTLYLETDIHHYRPIEFFLHRASREQQNARQLRQVLDDARPDIVVVWGMWNLSAQLAGLAEQWMPGRVAYSISSYWPIDRSLHETYWSLSANSTLGEYLKKPLRKLAMAYLRTQRVDRPRIEYAMCCSAYLRDRLVAESAISPRSVVIYNGIDPRPFLSTTPLCRKPYSDTLELLYFGSVISEKGVETAVESLAILKNRGLAERVRLTILGSGHPDYVANLRASLHGHGLTDRVKFCGRVPRTDVASWLERCDAYLFTSTWPEPMARTVMEAMAAGRIVIGSEVGGQTEMLHHNENALTFPAGDAIGLADRIETILNDRTLGHRLAQSAREFVIKEFSLDRRVDRIERFLRDIAMAS